jgi:hypothetical protein
MSDSTTPQDDAAMSPASAGSVAGRPVAWAALRDDGDIAWIGYTPEGAADGACGRRIVPLYRQPQDGVVRLPPLDPNGAPGWNAAISAVREALAEAGVDWDTE